MQSSVTILHKMNGGEKNTQFVTNAKEFSYTIVLPLIK